ncbi:hypothetical protein [Sphingomonas profundi]|uniref:hypothetical protein n=1 Tax=Alterirhizorhabdus profundi TaxID=2681549 RepID=UPI0012E7B1C8|nr:hypothetical protein [Sphingomonas profundi]
MAEKGAFDPMAAWSQFVTKWEQEVNDFSAKISASKEFGSTMNQASTMSRAVQQSFSEQMEKVLKAMNLPSQGQVSDLSDRLLAVEEKLDRLAIAVSDLKGDTREAAAPVRRTRQPPPATDTGETPPATGRP